jgi:hypothetical protein
VVVNLILKLRGEERIIDLLAIILEVVGENDLEEKLQLGLPFDQITVIQQGNRSRVGPGAFQ